MAFLEFAVPLKIFQVRLNDHFVELGEDLSLVLGVFAEREDEVLGAHTGRLRACEEESEHLVDDAIVSVLEVILYQNYR